MKLPSLATASLEKSGLWRWLVGGVVGCVAIGCLAMQPRAEPSNPVENAASRQAASREPIQPLEAIRGLDPKKVNLGRKLFDDPRLSHDNKSSCSTCHDLTAGGTDRLGKSIGINGAVGAINAPTVLNSALNFRQFWDGRADTLESQIDGPIQSKSEMGSTWPEVIGKLTNAPEYALTFRQLYGDRIRVDHVKNAIAEYERSLSTPNSRFDRYLRGESDVLTGPEERGYQLFKSFGCASCHQGVNIGGNMYQKVGVMAPYFTDRGNIGKADFGRFNVTGDPRDMYMFKVPSLRNVDLTAPYFHDGTAATLGVAVSMMAKYQLGHPLRNQEAELIVDFLKTLTGELNGQPL